MALSNPYDGPRVPGAVGRELPGVSVDIVDDGGRATARAGEPGELRVRTPQMFSAYHGDPAATAASFDEEGRFRTGDTGMRDADGVVRLLGRTSIDIIKSGGYKLSALEIEDGAARAPRRGRGRRDRRARPDLGRMRDRVGSSRAAARRRRSRSCRRSRASGSPPTSCRARSSWWPSCRATRWGRSRSSGCAPQRQCQESDDERRRTDIVVVHETKDAAQGEMLAELLRNEGIEARFRGPSTTLVGAARTVIAMAVEVPAEQEARARQFLQDLEETTGSAGATPVDDVEE